MADGPIIVSLEYHLYNLLIYKTGYLLEFFYYLKIL